MVPATGKNGWLQCQLLEWVKVSAASYWGGNGVCPENQLTGGTGVSEASEGLNASG